MNKKMLSVIVPIYNAGEYLLPLINSILKQTWRNLELILVDDGSSDGSGSVCDAIALEDKRVIVVHKNNEGQSIARNVGLKNAKGDYIAFADHDDFLHPYMYETLIQEMERTNARVCAGLFKNVRQEEFSSIECVKPSKYQVDVLTEKELVHNYLTPTWKIPIWTKVYCREVLENMKFSNHHLGEDNLFSYNVIKKCKEITLVSYPFYYQRMHGKNFEFTGIKYFVELLEVKEKILHDIKKTYAHEYKNAQKLFLYEGIRLMNAYVDVGVDKYSIQIRKIIKMIKRNYNNPFTADLPIGHKILFMRLKYSKKLELKKIII